MKPTRLLIAAIVLLSAVCLALSQIQSTEGPGNTALAADRESTGDAKSPLVVHEWGTFTSFSGSNGVKLEFRPLIENDLPPFVYNRVRHSRVSLLKSSMPAIQRMETPVTYFYTPVERDVTVRVGFPQGLLTEFYPPVRAFAPPVEGVAFAEQKEEIKTPLKDSMLDWGQVHLIPPDALRAHVQDEVLAHRIGRHVESTMLPVSTSYDHYAAARQTDSAIVQVRHRPKPEADWKKAPVYVPPGDYFEKFLFYRGLGNFDLPLTLTAHEDGTFTLANSGSEEIRSLFLVDVHGESIQFRKWERIGAGSMLLLTAATSTAATTLDDLAQAVVSSLVAEGLYLKEAQAMVNVWRKSWFGEEGTRLFYIVPQSYTDALLPLTIEPQPTELVRVLVGRMEIMTPTHERKVLDMVQRSAAARKNDAPSPLLTDLLAMGRLAEPALVRARHMANEDSVQQEAERLVLELRAAHESQK